MIERIIAFSARRRVLVLSVVAILVVVAWPLLGRIRLDALPDLSDTQVIVYSRWDRSADIVEDQVTYPIVTALLGTPGIKAIRGYSDFGYSFVHVVFEDGTDPYWARSRVLEYVSKIRKGLPAGVTPELGPDATGVGWVFQYALVDTSGGRSPTELRSFQDWTLRYALQSVPGVAEVASIGGYVRQYQITVDPGRLQAYGVTTDRLAAAIRESNDEVGGRLIEMSGAEYMVRGRGYARRIEDFESIVLKVNGKTPVLLRNVARVELGPEMRRGVSDLDGRGDTVGGIVVMRQGENALRVIERVKARLKDLERSLPEGVSIVTVYDRSSLIERALTTLRHEMVLQMIVVSLVILIFLWHVPSAIVSIVTIPVSILLTFIPLYYLGVSVNIMSLAGIAISIGVLVDGSIVEMENAYNRLYLWDSGGRREDFRKVRIQALQEVGPAVFFSHLIVAVAFIPIFALGDQEGRLFRPLAWSKNLTMAMAAVLALTLDPALRTAFARVDPFAFRPAWLARLATRLLVGTYRAAESNPIHRVVTRLYLPACRFVLRRPRSVLGAALLLVAVSLPVYFKLGREFMPELNEGTILFMPTMLPGVSVAQAQEILTTQDRALRDFPEVERVFGKAGRADTATDPAPLSMIETTVVLRPESRWRERPRWYSGWAPSFLKAMLRPLWPDRMGWRELVDEMNRSLQIPGVANAWTMPIKGRTDMLSTGIRTPLGIKILGRDSKEIERIGIQIEALVREIPRVRSVYAERTASGFFVDFEPRREQMARYGLSLADLHRVVLSAIGGEVITTTVEGRERYPVNLRYGRELREDPEQLERVLVATPTGVQIPLGQVASIRIVQGPVMLRDENGFLAGYVYVDVEGSDLGGFADAARKDIARLVSLPTGYSLIWSGQFENMVRVRERMRTLIPLTLALIFGLLVASTRSLFKSAVVMLAVPFSAIGAVWLFYALGYDVSVAAWVGTIALLGLDAETAVFMLLFLDLSFEKAVRDDRLKSVEDLDDALVDGAVRRVRPKLMTVSAGLLGLMPIMISTSAGADVLKRIAAPMIGGLVSSFLLELLVYPAVYKLWKLKSLGPLDGSASQRHAG